MARILKHKRADSRRIAVVDVGSSKVACFIAETSSSGMRVLGVGHQLSKGIRGSVITDIADAETSIVAAVHAAEQMAGQTVENVMVSLSGASLASRSIMVEMELMGEEVSERDILDIVEQGRSSVAENGEQEVVHCFPTSYSLDGARGIGDPRRMFGERLSADMHVITASSGTTRNLAHCIARCHLNVEEFVAASHASSLACLEEDELRLGALLVDMGGATTGFSVFSEGKNLYSDVVPMGGKHVTSDVAKGLSTTLTHAERLKTLHGSCVPNPSDEQVMISAPQLGEDEEEEGGQVMPRARLVAIIRPRMEEIFEMIRAKLDASGVEHLAGRHLVLTGGASQLLGIRELAARTMGRQIRLAKPRALPGLAESVSGPAFSCALGMLYYATSRPLEERLLDAGRGHTFGLGFKSVGKWLKENF